MKKPKRTSVKSFEETLAALIERHTKPYPAKDIVEEIIYELDVGPYAALCKEGVYFSFSADSSMAHTITWDELLDSSLDGREDHELQEYATGLRKVLDGIEAELPDKP